MRFDRETYLAWMTGTDTTRPMLTELFGPLVGLDEQWRAQGATEAEIDLAAFDWDWVDRCGSGVSTGPMLGPRTLIEQRGPLRIERDGLGRVMQLDTRTATIPLPVSFPVSDMDSWRRVKPLFAWREDRVDATALAQAIQQRDDAGVMVEFRIPGGFDTLRELMGEEVACMAFYDQPELVLDILDTVAQTCGRALDIVLDKVTVDRLITHEDFAGRAGPLIGPDTIEQYVQPYYRPIWDRVRDAGGTLFGLDTDGNIDAVIPALMACGVNELYPMEPAAGMDIVATRQRFGPGLKLRGGIDKFVIRNGTLDDIDRELEYKLQPALRDAGGIVFALDHRIPDGTPIASYRHYADRARDILGLPPRPTRPTAFHRSA